ncbi:hypothetical protein [Vibrio aestuarianus]|nr:hypothetical protein [Vibrio aestuarianus]
MISERTKSGLAATKGAGKM